MTCSTMPKRPCWQGVRCSQAGSTSRAPARSAGSVDEFAVVDLLDALVRKSLLVADRSAERTRFSMLETIRQFAEEQLLLTGAADETRSAHARYFAGREADVLALWDSPRQREAYTWLSAELANLRAAFRWSADHGDIDTAAAIAFYAGVLGVLAEQYEPVTWAGELIEPAEAVGHRRLAQLYVIASQCHAAGRIDRCCPLCRQRTESQLAAGDSTKSRLGSKQRSLRSTAWWATRKWRSYRCAR